MFFVIETGTVELKPEHQALLDKVRDVLTVMSSAYSMLCICHTC